MPDDERPDPADMRFEAAVEELESIIDRIEQGEIGLEESLAHAGLEESLACPSSEPWCFALHLPELRLDAQCGRALPMAGEVRAQVPPVALMVPLGPLKSQLAAIGDHLPRPPSRYGAAPWPPRRVASGCSLSNIRPLRCSR